MSVMNERQKTILHCVVDHFIDSAQPISSKMVLNALAIQLSSASIRQVFARLDDQGYLSKLHTSSGRVPTTKGYRSYVNTISKASGAIPLQEYVSQDVYIQKFHYIFSQLLDRCAQNVPYVTMLMYVPQSLSSIQQLKYVQINTHYGLVLVYHKTGIVAEHYIQFEFDVSQCNITEAIAWITAQLKEDRAINHALVSNTFEAETAAFIRVVAKKLRSPLDTEVSERQLMIQNVNSCIALPDFIEKEDIQQFLDAMNDHPLLVQLLSTVLDTGHLNVLIGSEINDDRLKASSFVAVPIVLDGVPVACLGVLGPRRMDYINIIQRLSTPKMLAELIQV